MSSGRGDRAAAALAGGARTSALSTLNVRVSALAGAPFGWSPERPSPPSIHEVPFEQFVAAHPVPPRRLILDFDATDTPLHGEQEDLSGDNQDENAHCLTQNAPLA